MTVVEHACDSGGPNPRPAFLRPRLILVVLLGGMLGSAGRLALALALPSYGGIPWAVLIVNVLGAYLLGFLITVLGAGPETPVRRDLQLFGGTGMMGGFTTYSALASGTVDLHADPGLAISFALGSVVMGVAAAATGIRVGSAAVTSSSTPEAGS
jgi:CrcB protein